MTNATPTARENLIERATSAAGEAARWLRLPPVGVPRDRDDLDDVEHTPHRLLSDAATHLHRLADSNTLADLDGALVAVDAGTVDADGTERVIAVHEAGSREITEAIGYAITEYALLRDRAEDAMLRALILLDQAERREEGS